MKRYSYVFAFALIFTLFGCEESVKNSTLPAKYVATAQKYNGSYEGQFNGKPLVMNLEVKDSGLVTIWFNDSLLDTCSAQAGELLSFAGDTSGLQSATVALVSHGCGLYGNTIDLEIKGSTIEASVLASAHTEWHDGPVQCHGSPGGGTECHPGPGHPETVIDKVFTGRFSRH